MSQNALRLHSDFRKVGFLVGTRPDIIKMSPVIKLAQESNLNTLIIHSGQHYSPQFDKSIFDDVLLSEPDYRINDIKQCEFAGEQIAEMLIGIEEVLRKEQPDIFFVYGDTNSCLAGALAAHNENIPVGHIEAGLRSDDWRMPEERNRVIVDHIADYLFCPTNKAVDNAQKDAVHGQIELTGNTVTDAVQTHLPVAEDKSTILQDLNIESDQYFVLTTHRDENITNRTIIKKIIRSIEQVQQKYDKKIIFPAHFRTQKQLEEFDLRTQLEGIKGVSVIDPLGYLDFLKLQANTSLVLTDSGGVQEECCILQVPCVTLRDNTERPETVEVGANIVAGTQPSSVMDAVEEMLRRTRDWSNPFGDGRASERILSKISKIN